MKKFAHAFLAIVTAFFIISAVTVHAQEPVTVDDWGFISNGGWSFVPGSEPGSAGVTGENPPTAWIGLYGSFDPLTTTTDNAIVITGKIEFDGDPTNWSALRYGFYKNDSAGTLQYTGTDSTSWSGHANVVKGYLFTPRSGTNDQVSGNGGFGTQWHVNGGRWNSTWSGGTLTLGLTDQAPRRAELTAGIYDFAFSIKSVDDTTNEIRWYFVKEDNGYWFGGTVMDSAVTKTLNAVSFGMIDHQEDVHAINVNDVKVALGDGITIPEPPFSAFYVDLWGSLTRNGWPVLNDSTTLVGDGYMGADGPPQGAWATLRGGFGGAVEATETEAIVVTGQLEFIGDDPTSWSALRYGLFYHDSSGVLENQYTDSAAWSGKESLAHGYMFSPGSGTNDPVSGQGGNGSVWSVDGGTWLSTWSGGTVTMGVFAQAPRRAEMTQGLYNFAISVQPQGDGTNEVRWYLIKDDNSYWFGGIAIDTAQASTKFNGVCFGVNSGNGMEELAVNGLNMYAVHVDRGAPIVPPPPPFSSFYVDLWGSLTRNGWPVLNDSTTLVGDGYMGADGPPQGAWATLRGGFGGEVEATVSEAIVVTGQLEFIGDDPTSWSALRYGLFYHDSSGVLENQYTDSAAWSGKESLAHGYMFSPGSGTNDPVSGQGGNGSVWSVDGGTWLSTWSGGTVTMGVFAQAPRRAEMTQGLYNFAISVQPRGDGTNEVRWYLIKEDNSYWFGGIATDTAQAATKFNGVCFGINSGNGMENLDVTGFNVYAVQIDRGDPIVPPPPPFSSFYVDLWGSLTRNGWPVLNDSTTLVGDGYMGADGPPQGAWATLLGGFGGEVEATETEAIVVTGQLEFLGDDPTSWSALRYGLFYYDSSGVLENQYTDSAAWSGKESLAHGYMFSPGSGTNDLVSGQGGNGSVWSVNGGTWLSTWSGGTVTMGVFDQAPRRAEMTQGLYNFAMSVQPQGDGTNEVRWYLIKEDTSYWFGGTAIDTAQASTKFNGVCFGVNSGNGMEELAVKGLNMYAVHVDRGDPIVPPPPPFEFFYVSDWGFIGDRFGGWTLTPGEVVGNVSVSGDTPPTDWSAVRGDFGSVVTPSDKEALIVEGKIKLEGGGFEDLSSLRFGVFYSDSAGTLDSTAEHGYVWTGTEGHHSGYLFLPQEGTNGLAAWAGAGQQGSWGAVVDDIWMSPDGSNNYVLGTQLHSPVDAAGGAGTYNFAISIQPLDEGTGEIRFHLMKDDGSYGLEGSAVDDHAPLATEKFNSVAFAVNNSSTTAMHLLDVKVDLGDAIPLEIENTPAAIIPTEYSLSQNYPNPFNPSTTIKFGLPRGSDVSLVVYDILGRAVAKLMNGHMEAGYHKIVFDAANLASGIYFYKLEAGDFVNVKKLMLLK